MKTLILVLLVAATAVANAQQKSYTIRPFGAELRYENVFGIDTAGPRIYVAADTAGIFMFDERMDGPNTWHYVGLKGKHCQAVAISPSPAQTILVALDRRLQPPTTGELIYRSDDWGATWSLSQAGIDTAGHPAAIVSRLEFNPGNPSEAAALLQGTGTFISRDTGRSWSVIPGLEGFTINEIAWDRTRPGTLFVGGENMILQAVLLKSTDGGLTWRNTLDIDFHGDNVIDAIAIDPNNPDRMIAGTEGFILRSTDAGERWTVVTEPGRYYMYGATWSNTEPETIFVTGGNSAPNSGGIFLSADNGATWSTIDTNRWRTVQRAIVSPTMPGALLFTTGTVAGQSDNGMPGGVYLVIAETASVPPGSSSAVVWQSERSVHIRNIEGHGPLRWNLVDLRGISSGSGTVGAGEEHTIRLDALPSGVHMLRYSDAAGVSTLKVVVVE